MKPYARRALGVITAVILVISIIPLPAQADTNYTVKNVSTYVLGNDELIEMQCLFSDDMPVPYVDVEDFLNKIYEADFSTQSTDEGVYKVGNSYGEMIIDTRNDTIHFDELEQTLYRDDGDSNNHYKASTFEYLSDVSYLDINLSNYDIDIIEYQNHVYMPINTISDIISCMYFSGVYANDKISIDLSSAKPQVDMTTFYNSKIRNANEVKYTYKELCFVMDYTFGCPPLCEMSDIIRENGFDYALSHYSDETRRAKDLINSNKLIDYITGIRILSCMLYDGGHDELDQFGEAYQGTLAETLWNEACLDPDNSDVAMYWRLKYQNIGDTHNREYIDNFDNLYNNYTPLFDEKKEGGEEQSYRYYEYNDTGIYVFDDFSDDTVRTFKKALDLAKEHGMKNFLFDISGNGGGDVNVMLYMICAVTGDNGFYFRGPKTNNFVREGADFDFNGDGVYEDNNDSFDYDFNYGVLCSRQSYSCANLFACRLQDEGIPIIGETSGGGTCNAGCFRTPNTAKYSLSSIRIFTHKNGEDVEDGATPDYDITKLDENGKTDYSDFRNFALLDWILNVHYNGFPSNDGGAYDTQTVKVSNVPKTADKYFLTIRFIYDLISII